MISIGWENVEYIWGIVSESYRGTKSHAESYNSIQSHTKSNIDGVLKCTCS